MLIYIVENNDWEFYNKYGWTTRFERVLDSHEFFPYLTKYGRFINKQNALISRMLGEGFYAKCKA